MSNVWFGSDFHFGHKRIAEFRKDIPWFDNEESHREWLIEECNKVLTKRDVLYLLGDIVFHPEYLTSVSRLECDKKILIKGNHDIANSNELLEVFDEVHGLIKYKHFWLSHPPIHPMELRGKVNLHGHTHNVNMEGNQYLNCCVENLMKIVGRPLISLDEIRNRNV